MKKTYTKAISIVLGLLLIFSIVQTACFAAGAVDVDLAGAAANDSFENAKQISVNTSYTDSLSSNKEEDYFKFTLSKSAMIAVNFNHAFVDSSNTYWIVRIYNANDLTTELLKFSVKGKNINSISQSTGLPSGSYYVKIAKDYYNDMEYTFSLDCTVSDYWEKEYNNEYTSASYVEVNKEYSGSLMSSSDVDYYYFSLSSPAKTAIDFTHEIVESSNKYWVVELYTEELNKISKLSIAGNKPDTMLPSVGLPAGKYYIKILDDYSNSMDYHFTVNCTASNYWEKEINNDYYSASVMSINNTYNGSLCTTDDIDFYRFSLSSASKINIDFSHELVDTSNTYWKINLYDSSYERIMSMSIKGKESFVASPNVGLPAGEFYIKINDDYYNGMDYEIRVNSEVASNWETELNNDYSTGDDISFNTVYYSSMCDTNDVDYYRFTLNSTADISIDFEHDYYDSSNTYWRIYLHDTNGNQKLSFNSKGNKTSTSSSTTSLEPGDYYIKINDDYYNGIDYKFVVNGPVTTYTITYNANGGSGAPASQTKYQNQNLTLSSTKPTRSGYTFLGWSTSSTATTATYAPGDTYTTNASATLYAVWRSPILLGDADGDGKVTVIDATAIQRNCAQISVSSFDKQAADIDESGVISVSDATYIQRWLANISCPYRIGETI